MGFPQSPQAHLFSCCSEGLTAPQAAASRESLGGLTSHLAGLQGTRRKWGHPAQGLLSRWPSPGSVNDYLTAINIDGSGVRRAADLDCAPAGGAGPGSARETFSYPVTDPGQPWACLLSGFIGLTSCLVCWAQLTTGSQNGGGREESKGQVSI